MMEGLRVAVSAWQKYYASFLTGAALMAGPAVLLFWRRKNQTARLLAFSQAAILLIIFFPVSASLVIKMIGRNVYWRMFWLLPVTVSAAWLLTELVTRFSGRIRKWISLLICIAAVSLCGNLIFTDQYFSPRQNNQKLPREVIMVADAIGQDAQLRGVKLKKTVSPSEIAVYIRIYDGTVCQQYGRNTVRSPSRQGELFRQINSDSPDISLVAKYSKQLKCRYVVLRQEQADDQKMTEGGFEKVWEDPSYKLYFNSELEETG